MRIDPQDCSLTCILWHVCVYTHKHEHIHEHTHASCTYNTHYTNGHYRFNLDVEPLVWLTTHCPKTSSPSGTLYSFYSFPSFLGEITVRGRGDDHKPFFNLLTNLTIRTTHMPKGRSLHSLFFSRKEKHILLNIEYLLRMKCV